MTRAHRVGFGLTPRAARSAFTLIEVLIGVLVLSLGLLGLGAIIPVIVREQRDAANVSLGIAAANAAEAYLRGRPDLDPASVWNYVGVNQIPQRTVGWDDWLLNPRWSPDDVTSPQASFLWEPWTTTTPPGGMDFLSGDFSFHFTNLAPPNLHATIKLADRLWPNESVQGEDVVRVGLDPHRPQFVWDFIGRRVKTPAGQPQQLQIAIFVRRIDQNVRVPRRMFPTRPTRSVTLRDVLLDRLPNSPNDLDRALPVCANLPIPTYPPQGLGTGIQYLPTNTGTISGGTPTYSAPIFVDAQFDPHDPDRLEFAGLDPSTDTRWKLLSQPGQKLLDNLGNVYTVRGIPADLDPGDPGRPTDLMIDPPIPSYVPDPATVPANAPGTIRQIVFTPQIPAAIRVFTITRAAP